MLTRSVVVAVIAVLMSPALAAPSSSPESACSTAQDGSPCEYWDFTEKKQVYGACQAKSCVKQANGRPNTCKDTKDGTTCQAWDSHKTAYVAGACRAGTCEPTSGNKRRGNDCSVSPDGTPCQYFDGQIVVSYCENGGCKHPDESYTPNYPNKESGFWGDE